VATPPTFAAAVLHAFSVRADVQVGVIPYTVIVHAPVGADGVGVGTGGLSAKTVALIEPDANSSIKLCRKLYFISISVY